ncbi:DUF2231 domain-containing protein [Pelagibacterium lacus]|uniref:DUF2231 domain-containing protein n=1 Tax=Pelagibacterium lacus TaxID=2282655 RepID=A0A369W8X5_9HYPH|nr:DUF2231 domain-containing protein [Pelagibacterium lacus]RDE09712.1 DUF2231 domain-containing protein [Pelagibacterium lacus]
MSEADDKRDSPVIAEVMEDSVQSAVAVAGHPIHAMMVHFPIALVFATLGADIFYWWTADPFWVRAGVWSAGFAFWFGVAAGLAGTAELVLVKGIRGRVGSWTHAIAAMTLLAIAGTNWGLRLSFEDAVLPAGLALSVLAALFTGLAGYHGGKLVFDHGVGILVDPNE